MGPRLMSRGFADIETGCDDTAWASMGPRLMSRGFWLVGKETFAVGKASMGPRLMSRGFFGYLAFVAWNALLQWGRGS